MKAVPKIVGFGGTGHSIWRVNARNDFSIYFVPSFSSASIALAMPSPIKK